MCSLVDGAAERTHGCLDAWMLGRAMAVPGAAVRANAWRPSEAVHLGDSLAERMRPQAPQQPAKAIFLDPAAREEAHEPFRSMRTRLLAWQQTQLANRGC